MQPVDQDTLQLMDETNKEWVEAWRKVVFKSNPKKEKAVTVIQLNAVATVTSS
jgi:hypothetical protein